MTSSAIVGPGTESSAPGHPTPGPSRTMWA
jgi:hypothetical protein